MSEKLVVLEDGQPPKRDDFLVPEPQTQQAKRRKTYIIASIITVVLLVAIVTPIAVLLSADAPPEPFCGSFEADNEIRDKIVELFDETPGDAVLITEDAGFNCLPADIFFNFKRVTTVQRVDIIGLELESISPDAFLTTKDFFITQVNISHGGIKELPAGLFDPLEELFTLDISNNRFKTLPDDLFAKNLKLDFLTVERNPLLENIPFSINASPVLQVASFRESRALKQVPKNLLEGTNVILDIAFTFIEALFTERDFLVHVGLDPFSSYLTFAPALNRFKCDDEETIRDVIAQQVEDAFSPVLKTFRARFLTCIPSKAFSKANQTKLAEFEILDFSRSDVSIIDGLAFVDYPGTVKKISFAGNSDFGNSGRHFLTPLTDLEEIDLSDTEYSNGVRSTFEPIFPTELNKLNLSGTLVEEMNTGFNVLDRIDTLDLSNCLNLIEIEQGVFAKTDIKVINVEGSPIAEKGVEQLLLEFGLTAEKTTIEGASDIV